jgi:mannose-6-phosphate isomerase-like protein (cupin superfamily)
VGNLRERDHLEDTGEEERNLLKWIFMKRDGDMDWNCLYHGREIWRVLVNAVITPEFL